MRVLYDVVNKKEILFENNKDFLERTGYKLNYKLFNGKSKCAYGRFILPERVNEIFTIMDIDTGEKFDIFDHNTLSFHLGDKLSKNEFARLSCLKTSKIILTTIKGRTFKNLDGDPNKAKGRNKFLSERYKDLIPARSKRWREKNVKHRKERLAKWRSENKDHIKDYNREYSSKRRIDDPEFKLRMNLRNRIKLAIKKSHKSAATEKLTGCTIEFLRGYLENKFTEGMTWENYGEWHVDHIIPCSYYDLSIPENQYKCFHYTNLQPLWAADNMKKRAQVPTTIPELDSKAS